MKLILLINVLVFCFYCDCSNGIDSFESTLGHINTKTSPKIQVEAVAGLIKRLIPEKHGSFNIAIDPEIATKQGIDTFKLEKVDGIVKITGTTGVAAASGFHYYLKYFCNCHVSWEAVQLNLPDDLPEANLTITMNDRFRYYQNVCTTSYSFVWWSWEQWEKHIDWMALNSFNLVLAFNGQEAIWDRVYRKFNLTDQDIDEQFSGPAFLSWLRMGNLRGWGGPLSKSWHDRSLILQKKILERMRSFGIIPVLPAFSGQLPVAFKRLFPHVNMVKTGKWNGFEDKYCCPYFLDPTEGLFKTIGKMFIEEQINEYGTNHVYNCDSFNEVDPVSTDLKYLSNVGKNIYEAMVEADPDSIWLMQGWLFVHSFFFWTYTRAKALLTSVPKGKMIILDLQSEQFPQYDRLEQYFGQPYIWCMLHNFGGTLGMFGSLDIINKRPVEARNRTGSTMIGTGLTPEGINQNYIVYDFMAENAWRKETEDLEKWIENYTVRRYGQHNKNIVAAWKLLKDSVYNFKGLEHIRGQYIVTKKPNINLSVWSWYRNTDVFQAWDYFIDATDSLQNSSAFLHDLVDVTRQALQLKGDIYYEEMISNYKKKDLIAFNDSSDLFLRLFTDMEEILASSDAFLIGNWINDAKTCANSSEEEDQFEYNARNQITLWGPNGEIMNYANKQWSGVVEDFFQPRWQYFVSYLKEILVSHSPYNNSYIKNKIFKEVEEPFTFDDNKIYPTKAKGNSIEIAKRIHSNWWYENNAHLRTSRSKHSTVPYNDYDHKYEKNNVINKDAQVILV